MPVCLYKNYEFIANLVDYFVVKGPKVWYDKIRIPLLGGAMPPPRPNQAGQRKVIAVIARTQAAAISCWIVRIFSPFQEIASIKN